MTEQPVGRGGIMDLAKRVAGRAVEEAQQRRVAAALIDKSPGVRWLRKHRVDPRSATSCRCRGCDCTRFVATAGSCGRCGRGRHARSLLSKATRRAHAGPNRSIRKVEPRHRRRPASVKGRHG